MVLLNRLTALSFGQALTFSPLATDEQLVYRYARGGEQAAFELLMRRHGSMVWGVCRRLLGNVHDAEDAFQATFLVLARKAGSLHDAKRLPAWLHGVARRTALHLKARRRRSEPLTEAAAIGRFDEAVEWYEYRGLLDDAIARLPSKLRTAFLLCHAEGLTAALTAKRMNLPEGTVVSRVHRARTLLKRYLGRCGVSSTAGAAAIGVTVPETVVGSALRAVMSSSTPLIVASLAQGVIATMTWMKLTTAAVVFGILGLAGTGAGMLWAQQGNDGQAARRERQESREDLQKKVLTLELHTQQLKQIVEKLKAENDIKRAELEKLYQQLEATRDFLNANMLATAEAERRAAAGPGAKKSSGEAEAALRRAQDELEKYKNAAVQQRDQLAQAFQELNQRRTQEQQEEEKAKVRQAQLFRQQVERLTKAQHEVEDDVKKSQMRLQALTNQDPRLAFPNAEEVLSKDLLELRTQLRFMENSLQAARNVVKQRAPRDEDKARLEDANVRDHEKLVEDLKARLKAEQEVFQRNLAGLQMYRQYQARLQSREKLLLEVEEKLLRTRLELP